MFIKYYLQKYTFRPKNPKIGQWLDRPTFILFMKNINFKAVFYINKIFSKLAF